MPPRGEPRPLSVAPMMDHTDRHLRWVLRQISRRTLLYTEMVVDRAVLRGDREKLLGFDPEERPLALQLGGDDPALLAEAAAVGWDFGYDEIDLNVGCPSDRVQSGCFGAALMKRPERVAEIVAALRARVPLPVTVKHRIGVDELGSYEHLRRFVDVVAEAGCDRFVVHARIAILAGLSPKQNREVPPLRYPDVYRLAAERPDLRIEINGGVRTLAEARQHLAHVQGVMIGRAVIDDPWVLAGADEEIHGEIGTRRSREEVVRAVAEYVARNVGRRGFEPRHVHRHLSGLFSGVPGARIWRRTLSERADDPQAVTSAFSLLPSP